ncbi:putative ribonuclease H-like domain-containing protein [Tanacetum coccineum]
MRVLLVHRKIEKPTIETNEPKTARKENGAPIIEDWVSDSDEENVPKIVNNNKIHKKVNTELSEQGLLLLMPQAVLSGCLRETMKMLLRASASWVLKDQSINFRLWKSTIYARNLNGGFVPMGEIPRKKITWKGYSTNSKAFRVFNSRTKIVEKNLHVKFSKDTPNIAGSTKACDDAGKTRMEIVPSKDYILLPLWTQDPPFSSSSKDSPYLDLNHQREEEKMMNEDPGNEDINVTIYDVSNDLNMPELEEIDRFSDAEDDISGADINNLDTYFQVSPVYTTRIHKDHPIKQIIGDLNSAPQTRRMTRNLEEYGFLNTTLKQRRDHKDIQNCLFACFLSQEEPKKLPNGKRAIGTKWGFQEQEDESGIVIKNKARLVAQGYIQEDGIDYDEFSTLVSKIEAIRLFLAYASFKDLSMCIKVIDSNEKKLIQMIKIHTDQNVADLLTKAFDVSRFQYLIASIGMLKL